MKLLFIGPQSLSPGTYESLNPLNPLVGCPLNGIWQIEFCDLWGADDGFVFDFSVDFDPSLYPVLTTFTPSIGPACDSTFWTSTGIAATFITSTSPDCNDICITPTDTGSFSYTFVVLDDFGCTYDTTISISVIPGPQVNAGNDTTICIGSTAQLNASAVNAAPLACDYTIEMYDTWGDGWNGFEVEVIINGVSIGNFTFSTGSTSTDIFSVLSGDNIVINTVSGSYDSEVSYQILDCNGNVVFSNGVNYGGNPQIGNNIWNGTGTSPQLQYNYSWTPTTGLSKPNIENPIATVNANTTYIVEIWEPGHQACGSFDTVNVFINSVAFAGIDSNVTVCPGDTPFDMFIYLGGTPDNNGVWYDNGVVTSNIFNPQTAPSGSYSYTYLINNPTCPDSAQIDVIVLPLGDISCGCPLNGYTTTVDEACFGDCNGEVVVTDSLNFAIDYSLDLITWQSDSTFLNLCAGNLVAYTRNPLYGPTCIDTLNFVIISPPPFLITQLDSVNETCYNDCDGEITITSPGALLYSVDNGASFQNDSLFTNICPGAYDIVTVDNAGCMSSGIISVTGLPEVIADFSADPQPTFVPFTEITFTNQSQGQIINLWNVSGVDSFNTENLVYKFAQVQDEYQVCLFIENDNGCKDEICKMIYIKDELSVFIPNAFTPNFNNKNELFIPVMRLDMVVEYTFQIFDRWGELIFETKDPTQGWNGSINNGTDIVQTGVYVYKVKIKDTNNKYHNYVGSVNLIK